MGDDGFCMLTLLWKRRGAGAMVLTATVFLASCGKKAPEETATTPPVAAPAPAPMERKPVPDTFRVKFETTKGDFVLEVNRSWAPLGAERFHQLVSSGYYDGSKFFRVVPGFVVQFGLAADPNVTRQAPGEMPDDPVTQSNTKGTITFATRGPNSRTTQVFINLVDNRRLDQVGFSPFGTVVEGLSVVEQLYGGYGDNGPDQGRIRAQGNSYLETSFPNLDGIKKATIQ
jgi:peptidyl-prolyl cis-trans isomerase A (cyclophilin A)